MIQDIKKYNEIVIEYKDDICLIGDDNKTLCQLKTITAENKRITNSSSNLWKTIYNWICYLNEGDLVESDEIILLVQNKIIRKNYMYYSRRIIIWI